MVTHIRLPDPKTIDEMFQGAAKRSEMGERKLKTAIANALASIETAIAEKVLQQSGLDERSVKELLKKETRLDNNKLAQLKKIIVAMQKEDRNGLTLYPNSAETTRSLTRQEAKDITALADKVAATMRAISNGHHDTYVKNVFGANHVAAAKKVFKGAADALISLKPGWFSSGIVVDTMRKEVVWCCQGLTRSSAMALSATIVAQAKDLSMEGDAFLTLVHESTHALPIGATTDALYDGHQGFLTAGEQVKLQTADYYKEVVRQIAKRTGRPFTPGSVDPHLNEPRSPELANAVQVADKILNGAWITAIRIHDVIQKMAHDPGRFVGWETWLRNASRLMGLTLHREDDLTFDRGGCCSASSGPRITNGDLALIDNKIAMLAACNGKGKYVMKAPTMAGHDPPSALFGSNIPSQSFCRRSRYGTTAHRTPLSRDSQYADNLSEFVIQMTIGTGTLITLPLPPLPASTVFIDRGPSLPR